ncbi:YybH family protein [Nocardia pseudobrasiliensis]|nr:nuclear transport factor 2 family protein [Nocardia pseudobrasiliensis]
MTDSTTTNIELPTEPGQLSKVFEFAFNSGNIELMEKLLDPAAIHVVSPGNFLTGEERRRATAKALENPLPVTSTIRHVYEVGDIALLINDYVHEGIGPDGEPTRIEGTATDIARRGQDGIWRIVVSNPPGASRA